MKQFDFGSRITHACESHTGKIVSRLFRTFIETAANMQLNYKQQQGEIMARNESMHNVNKQSF